MKGNYTIENLKAGKYLMIALKDENNSNKYEPRADRIGFIKEEVTIPSDETYDIKLFTEEQEFKVIRPKQIAGQKIVFPYQGNAEDLDIELLSEKPSGFQERIVKDPKADSLYYWYTPKIKADSLLFTVSKKSYIDSMYVNRRDMKLDTLTIKSASPTTLRLKEDFEIEGSVPFKSIDKQFITLMDKDSVAIDFTTKIDSLQNRYVFSFDKTEAQTYNMQIFPGGIKDIFEQTNDTLNYRVRTKKPSDYGRARIILENAVYPVIVQLTDSKGKVIAEDYAEQNKPFDFDNLNPGQLFIRVVFDTNKNGKWDTGNYLKKLQPERISYYPKGIEVRANWDVVETFTLN